MSGLSRDLDTIAQVLQHVTLEDGATEALIALARVRAGVEAKDEALREIIRYATRLTSLAPLSPGVTRDEPGRPCD